MCVWLSFSISFRFRCFFSRLCLFCIFFLNFFILWWWIHFRFGVVISIALHVHHQLRHRKTWKTNKQTTAMATNNTKMKTKNTKKNKHNSYQVRVLFCRNIQLHQNYCRKKKLFNVKCFSNCKFVHWIVSIWCVCVCISLAVFIYTEIYQ